jgi:hypothetical protein
MKLTLYIHTYIHTYITYMYIHSHSREDIRERGHQMKILHVYRQSYRFTETLYSCIRNRAVVLLTLEDGLRNHIYRFCDHLQGEL